MFYITGIVAIFFLIFFVKQSRYTYVAIVFFLAILIASRFCFTTYDVEWNISFLLLFVVSIFLFRVLKQVVKPWNLLIIIGLIGLYSVIEIIHLRYAEFIRIDLALLSGLALFFLAWFFERNLRIAFCLSVSGLFLATILFALGQILTEKAVDASIGTLTHLNAVGWMGLAFIFFSLCERIQLIEKNYG